MSEPLREDARASDDATTSATSDASASGSGLGPPTAMESLIGALLEAGPDVAEHVVKAAQELVLAVQVVVDAADRAVQEQQTVRTARAPAEPTAASADRDDAVRPLDLAE